MRSSLSPYVLKSSANNSKGKNVYNNHSGISYKQSAIDATLEKLSDYIRSNISDKITIDIGLSLVEDTREIFQRTLRDKVSSSSTIDKENINTFSSNISKEMSYFNDPSNTSPSKEHFESLASRESMVSMLSRPSVGEVLINSSTDNVTPQNIVDQQSSSPMFSTITRRSKRNKNGNLISSSKVTFADIISPAAASNVNKDQKSAKSSTSKLKQAPSSMVKCHDLDTTLKLDSLTADSSSLCRSSVYSASSVLDTTLVYDPTVDDDVNEENILSPHRFSLLDRTMLEASAEKNDSEKFSSSFNLNDESYRVSLSPTKEDTIIRESKPIQLSEEDSNTPFKVMKRGRKGRKSVSGHIFKLERFRDEEPGELDEVKNAMENMTLGHYDDEAVNIVGIPFSPHTQERLSVIEDESGQSYSTESMALDNASSPTKELDQQEGSSDIAARRPTRRASVQCKEKISDVDNAKDKRMKKTKPPESKPIKRIESVYQSLTTLQASIIDKSFLLLEELSVESFTEARGRVEAVVSHLNNGAYSESAETTALALLLAISNVPNGYPQSVFEYLIMLPELMRPSSCESIINHTDNTTIGKSKSNNNGYINIILL